RFRTWATRCFLPPPARGRHRRPRPPFLAPRTPTRSVGYGAKRAGWGSASSVWTPIRPFASQATTLPLSGEGKARSATHQRAAAILERTECLGRRNGGADIVEVARMLGVSGLLHLVQIRVVDLAAVLADRPLAEQRIVGRQFLHLGDDRLAVGSALQGGDRLEIVQHAGVNARLHHGRELARTAALRRPTLAPGPIGIVLVPIPRLGQRQALCGREAKRVDVAREHEKSGELLAALGNAEFGGRLDRVDGVA